MEGVMHPDDASVTRRRAAQTACLALMLANRPGRGIWVALPISRAQSNKTSLFDVCILDFAISNDVCLVDHFDCVSLAIGPVNGCDDLWQRRENDAQGECLMISKAQQCGAGVPQEFENAMGHV